ncbi:MAG TPA: extracellular solute-binding protein [Thermomicrobiales bacterium]|nr:extracellular solute-binding protein [Thermomicrobiales bacterium]
MTQKGDVRDLIDAVRAGRLSRRAFVQQAMAAGLSASAVAGLMMRQQHGAAAQSETPKFNTTLKLSTGETYPELFKMYGDQVKEQYGVDFEYTMTAPQDMYQKDMLEFASGSSSHDIVLFQPAWLPDYAPHLEDLGALAEKYGLNFQMDDALDVFKTSYTTWEGAFLAVPIDADQHNLYYNKTAFEDQRNKDAYQQEVGSELRVPQTWDEYVQVAKFFSGRDWDFDGEPEYGVSEAWQRGGYAWYWWQSKFFGFGGLYFDADMKPLINSAAGVKALEVQVGIKDFVPPGTANFGSPEARNAFMNGDAPMVVHWTSTAKLSKDPESSKIVDVVGVAEVPGVQDGDAIYRRPALPTGWVAGIPKYSKNVEASARILEFYLQPERSLAIALNPAAWCEPWRTSSFDPEAWLNFWPDDPDYAKQLVEVMQATLKDGVPDLQIPGQDEYVKVADTEISTALTGGKDPQQALDDAAKEWENITERLGRDEQLKYWTQQLENLKARGIEYRPELAG